MTCPPGDMIGVNSPVASNDLAPSSGDTDFIGAHEKRAERAPKDRIVVSYFRRDPAQPPTARLELGTEAYNLVFHSTDVAEAKLHFVCSRDWLDLYEESMGERLRAISRANSNSDLKYVLSPIYAGTDWKGYQNPVLADHVALLEWGDDLQPLSVIIVRDTEPTTVRLRPVKQTSPKGPTHKGDAKLAA